jgi:hypothetical protein
MPFIENLEANQRIKKVVIGLAILILVAGIASLAVFSYQRAKTDQASEFEKGNAAKKKIYPEISKDSIESLTAPEKSQEIQDEQKSQDALNEVKESLTAPETSSNSSIQPSPISPKVLDSLNAK